MGDGCTAQAEAFKAIVAPGHAEKRQRQTKTGPLTPNINLFY